MMGVALMTMAVANAQVAQADIEASQKRVAELQKLVDSQPKQCGVAEVDGFAANASSAAVLAIANSQKLSELYGKKATGAEWVDLGTSVAAEAKQLKDAQDKAATAAKKLQDLGDEAKKGNPMAKAKAAKQVKSASSVMTYAKDALSILAVETVEQGKMVSQMAKGQ